MNVIPSKVGADPKKIGDTGGAGIDCRLFLFFE